MKKSERKGERKRTQQDTRRRKRDVFIRKKWTCINAIHNSVYIYICYREIYSIKKKQKIEKRFAACARAHASVFLVKLKVKTKKKEKNKKQKKKKRREK